MSDETSTVKPEAGKSARAPVPAAFLARRVSPMDRDRREVSAWLSELFARHSEIETPPPAYDWVQKHVELTPEESKQFPGKYNPGLSPCVSILFEFYESDYWDEFVGVKSSQLGMTLAALAIICHKIRFNPQDMAMAINNREEIKRIGEKRIKPMLKACKAIAHRIPADEDKLQNMTLFLLGLTLYLLGGNSVGAAANKSLGLVVIDECDETPEEMKGGESTILDLLRDRLKRQDLAKFIAFSKPRNEDDIIWPEYLHGSRHKVFVPCPHCHGEIPPEAMDDHRRLFSHLPQPLPQGYQTLVRAGLRYEHCRREGSRQWDLARMLNETFYECLWCKGRIEERHKAWMLARRLYLPTNTPDGALQDDCVTFKADRDPTETDAEAGHPQPVPGKLSFQVSDFYALSYQPRSTFGHLAVEIVTGANLSKQRKFRRSREGLPVSRLLGDNSRKIADILALQGDFKRGHCSKVPVIVIMGVDVQHYGRKWVKCAFYADDSCEVVDYGIVFKGFSDLLIEARKPVIVDDWGDVEEEERIDPVAELALIDEGDGAYTKRVLEFCTSAGAYRLFWPAKGRGGAQVASMTDLVMKQKKNRYNGKALPRYLFNSDAFHEELYDERIGRAAEIARAIKDGQTPPVGQLRLFKNPDTDLCTEFLSKRRWTEEDEKARASAPRKAGTRRGKIIKVGDWVRDGGPDDFPDAVMECLAAWYRLKPSLGIGEERDEGEDEETGEEVDEGDFDEG